MLVGSAVLVALVQVACRQGCAVEALAVASALAVFCCVEVFGVRFARRRLSRSRLLWSLVSVAFFLFIFAKK